MTYKSQDGYQDVWNKKIYQSQREARIEKLDEMQAEHSTKNEDEKIKRIELLKINHDVFTPEERISRIENIEISNAIKDVEQYAEHFIDKNLYGSFLGVSYK